MIPKELNYEIITKIYSKLLPYVLQTPIIACSELINDIFNTKLYLKLEFLQHAGVFKIRGAINNILNLSEKQKKIGVTAVSAGNHAIATAYAANKFNIKSKVFMYKNANNFRVQKVKSYNSNLILSEPSNAFTDMEKASLNEGLAVIHPFDGLRTIQGTASLGFEISEQINEMDNILISVGGGGLISGIGSIIKQKYPKCKIIGVEPEGAAGLSKSLELNKPISNVPINTIADSLSAPLHFPYSFAICKEVIDKTILVSDEELKNAMKFMFDNFKFILEPACVAGIAGLLGNLKNQFNNQKTLVILCGTNIDMQTWTDLTN